MWCGRVCMHWVWCCSPHLISCAEMWLVFRWVDIFCENISLEILSKENLAEKGDMLRFPSQHPTRFPRLTGAVHGLHQEIEADPSCLHWPSLTFFTSWCHFIALLVVVQLRTTRPWPGVHIGFHTHEAGSTNGQLHRQAGSTVRDRIEHRYSITQKYPSSSWS